MGTLSSHSMEVMVAIVEIIIMMTLAMILKEVLEVRIASKGIDEAAEMLTTVEMTMVGTEVVMDQTDIETGIEMNVITDLTEMAGDLKEAIATTDTLGLDQDRTQTIQEDQVHLIRKAGRRTNADKGEKEIAEALTMVPTNLQQLMLHQ